LLDGRRIRIRDPDPGGPKTYGSDGSGSATMVRTGSISLPFNIVYASTCHTKPLLRIRIRIDFGRLDPDPDPGGQKLPTKVEKSENISCFKVLDILL
jgi:hypothetical protein